MNMPYEMFLIIQMHLTCRKNRVQSPTRKEGRDLFRRTSDESISWCYTNSPLLLIQNETSLLTYWISAQSQCCPGRDGRHLEMFREIWMNVVLAKVVA